MSCEDVEEQAWTVTPLWTTQQIQEHYAAQLAEHGPGPRAVQAGPQMQQECFQRIAAALAPLQPGMLLDIGCGIGDLIPHLPLGWGYVGVDFTAELIDAARERYPARSFAVGDARKPLFDVGVFDVTVLCKTFSYTPLEEAAIVIREAWRVTGRAMIWLDNQFKPPDTEAIVRSLKPSKLVMEYACAETSPDVLGIYHVRYVAWK